MLEGRVQLCRKQ